MINYFNVYQEWKNGEITLEEANKKLSGTGFSINPNEEKIVNEPAAVFNKDFSKINGYAYLDTGTGFYDKVYVENGVLKDTNLGSMTGFVVFIGGEIRQVVGNKIV